MRKLNKAFGSILLLVLLSAFLIPGDVSAAGCFSHGRPFDGDQDSAFGVRQLVEQFPAQDAEQRERLSAELFRLGKKGILDLCRMLLPPEKGDDTKARYAVNALAT